MNPSIRGTIVSKKAARFFYMCPTCDAPVTFEVPELAFYLVRCGCGKETLIAPKLGKAPPDRSWEAATSVVEPDPD